MLDDDDLIKHYIKLDNEYKTFFILLEPPQKNKQFHLKINNSKYRW